MTAKNNDYTNAFRSRSFKCCDFPINIIYMFHLLDTFYLSSFFPKYYFTKPFFQLSLNVTRTDEYNGVISTRYRHKWGKIGPSHLFTSSGSTLHGTYAVIAGLDSFSYRQNFNLFTEMLIVIYELKPQ